MMNRLRAVRQFIRDNFGWLRLGLGLKRWLLLLGVGAAIAGMGVVYLILVLRRAGWLPEPLYDAVTLQFLPPGWRVLLPLLAGGAIMLYSVFRLGANLLRPFRRPGQNVVDSLYLHTRRTRGPRIVAIGGGTGLPTLLRGLKAYTNNITAVITVADDGGSSGRLRREFGVLPPGDFRNNMAALAHDEALLTQLFQYRFGGQQANGHSSLQGHAFGNLFLAALADITGGFDEALLAAGRVLAIRGSVMPSTLGQIELVAEKIEGEAEETAQRRQVAGESAITKAGGRISRVYLNPINPPAYPPAVKAILHADLIVLGPGSLYTSIIPNLLVSGIGDALRTTRAPVVHVCNLATQPGETDNYSVADHVEALDLHCPNAIDFVLANTNTEIPADRGGGHTVFVRPKWPPERPKDCRLIKLDLVDESRPWRHDSEKLASAILAILDGNLR